MSKIFSFFIFLSAFLSMKAVAAPCGSVLLARGEVEVISRHSSHLIQAGQRLECGDILVSRNGAATIEIARGKLVIGTYSRLEIADVNKEKSQAEINAINLIYGRTRVLIQKKQLTRFEVRTPSATAGVRGTDFFVSHDPARHVSHEATVEGQVEVGRFESTEEPIVVSGGSQVDVSIEPEEKEKPLKAEPISPEMKEEIRQASGVAKDDPDFTHRSAVKVLGNPADWETGGLSEEDPAPQHRLRFSAGPQWNMLLHNTTGLDGQIASGSIVGLQYEQAFKKNDSAWLLAISLGETKDRAENEYGVHNRFSMLNVATGIRLDHDNWWSPYVTLGLGFIRDHLTISRNDLNYFIDRDDNGVSLQGAIGLDARYDFSKMWGVFGKTEVQLGQTLFTAKSDVHSYNSGATGVPDQAAGNGVRGSSVGLALTAGLTAQF